MIDNKIRFCQLGERGGAGREDELDVVVKPVFFYLNKQFSKVRVLYYLLLLKKNNYLFFFDKTPQLKFVFSTILENDVI